MGTTTKRQGRYRGVPDEKLTRFELFLRKTTIAGIRFLERLSFYLVLVFIHAHYTFSLLYIRSRVVSDCSTFRNLIEGLLYVFVFINVAGNCFMNLVTDNSLKTRASHYENLSCEGSNDEGLMYCRKCNLYQPDGSWHCNKCDVCVVERVYHCFLFRKCVGRYNKRYYINGFLYGFIGMIYQTCYVFAYTCKDDVDETSTNTIVGGIASYIMAYTWYLYRLYKMFCFEKVFFMLLNVWTIMVACYFLGLNISFIIRGYPWEIKTAERKNLTLVKKDIKSRSIRKEIMEEIFGYRWYWAILWPFVSSPLPDPKKHIMYAGLLETAGCRVQDWPKIKRLQDSHRDRNFLLTQYVSEDSSLHTGCQPWYNLGPSGCTTGP